jgi:hypothetical protein
VRHLFGGGPTSRWLATALSALTFSLLLPAQLGHAGEPPVRKTAVTIVGDAFHINGQPTYPGRTWRGHKIEGLLMNSRMVQGIFDDLNPETVARWAYPDTGRWDADRNTSEFIAACLIGTGTACSARSSTFRAAVPKAIPAPSRGIIPPLLPTAHCGPTTWPGSNGF